MMSLMSMKKEPSSKSQFTVAVPKSAMASQESERLKLKKLKCVVLLASVLGMVAILIATCFTYIYVAYYNNDQSQPQMFRIVLHDKSSNSDSIPLDITADPARQLEYSRSPEEGADGDSREILGLKDFKKGVFAYKEEKSNKCLIGKIATNSSMHTVANGTVQEAEVEENEMFTYLNYTIHPFILRLAAGDNIAKFCGDRDAIWMIPMEEHEVKKSPKDEHKNVRVRRWKCKGWGCEGISHKKCFWNCKWVDERQKCTRRCVPK